MINGPEIPAYLSYKIDNLIYSRFVKKHRAYDAWNREYMLFRHIAGYQPDKDIFWFHHSILWIFEEDLNPVQKNRLMQNGPSLKYW